MSSERVRNWRRRYRDHYLWWLLPIFFVASFVVDNRTGVVNVFRIVVLLGTVLALEMSDLKRLWRLPPTRWFLLLMAWLSVTLCWDGIGAEDWKLLQGGLQVVVLLLLVLMLSEQPQDRQRVLLWWFLISGLLGLALILLDWSGTPADFARRFPELERSYYYTRGVFTISIFTGWMAAVLGILGLQMALRVSAWKAVPLYLLTSIASMVVFLTQARSAWLALGLGLCMAMLGWAVTTGYSRRSTTTRFAVAAIVVVTPVLIVFYALGDISGILADGLGRGDSYRVAIWRNGMEQLLSSPINGLVGFGLSASTANSAGGVVQSHYHSLYLNTFYYGGAVALVLYLLSLYASLRNILAGGQQWLWLPVLVPMQLAFLVDGEHFFVVPSAMMLAYLLPLFWAMTGFSPLYSDPHPAHLTVAENGPEVNKQG
ncbi:MAG: hypothetical protein CMK32_08795 [Porticoccaceae bacterium]|nr:hypothetical protein [Porticoccaceae bacterium]